MGRQDNILDSQNFSIGAMLVKYKNWYFSMLVICIVVNALLCLVMPKRYAAQVKISDEPKETGLILGMNNLAKWMNTGNLPNTQKEGINNPEVYPRILQSDELVTAISKVYLSNQGCTLYEYLASANKPGLWSKIGKWLYGDSSDDKEKIYSTIQKNIKYSIAPFYHNIIIQYTDKNPDVARTVLNAITEQLQSTITRQKHLLLYQALQDATRKRKELGKTYHASQRKYAAFVDANEESAIPSVMNKIDQMAKERDDLFFIYKDACIAEQRSKFLLMGKPDAFAVIQKAYVPVNPISPKPFPYLITILGLGVILTSWLVLYREKKATGKKTNFGLQNK